MNYENDLSFQLASTFKQYKNDVNQYILELFGNYTTTVASHAADTFRMALVEKYCALFQLTRNEVIHQTITECRKADFDRLLKYLNDFMDLHGIFQSITVKNNFNQNVLSVTKENYNIAVVGDNYTPPCLITTASNREVNDSGNIAIFLFELRDKKGKIGSIEAGVSTNIIADFIELTKKRIPYLSFMCVTDKLGQILFPESHLHNGNISKEVRNIMQKSESGFVISKETTYTIIGYASLPKLPFQITSNWKIICAMQTEKFDRKTT